MDVKDLARKNLKPIYGFFQRSRRKIEGFKYREKKVSYGQQNPDKTFYVIRNKNHGIGLMAYYLSVIGSIEYAEGKGWIPIIDMMNYENPYLDKNLIGKVNSWEYYFKQPYNYSLSDVYKSKNVVLSYAFTSNTGSPRALYDRIKIDNKYIDIAQKKILYSDTMEDILCDTYASLFPDRAKVLGVSSRGTDMINFPGHSRLPGVQQLINIAEQKIDQYRYEYLFLATEEQSVIDQFRDYFRGGVKIIVDNRMRYDEFRNSGESVLVDMHFDRENDAYLKGREYLISVGLLSKCDSLLGTIIGSTLAAICLNGNQYEHCDIIDLGKY